MTKASQNIISIFYQLLLLSAEKQNPETGPGYAAKFIFKSS